MLLQRLLPTHQLGFLGGVIITLNHTVEKRVEKPLQAEIDLLNLGALLVGYQRIGLGGLFLFLLNPFQHFLRPIRAKSKRRKQSRNLCVQDFFTDIWLLAVDRCSALLRATVIGVSLLNLAGNRATAFCAVEEAEKWLGHFDFFLGRIAPSAAQDGLRFIEQLFGDDGLVRALMNLAAVAEMPVVDRV